MSRCFSYPPPGYSGSQGSSQALIESIKLQRERELAKAETKKDRKREKKEKRKEKKAKSKSGLLPEKKIHKSGSTCLKSKSLQQLLQSETEQLERSSLTEEHAQPAGEQKPSTSSDSTQNSSKRKREASPPAVGRQEENSSRSSGNVIRIRLPSQKQNPSAVRHEPYSTSSKRTESSSQKQNAIVSRQEPCSTSGRTVLDTSNKYLDQVDASSIKGNNNVARVCPTGPEAEVCSASLPISVTSEDKAAVVKQLPERLLPPRPDINVCSTLGERKANTRDKDEIDVRNPISLDKKLVKMDLRYRDLVLNWVPPCPQMEQESDDQDWLFSKKNPDNQCEKRPKQSNNVSCGSSSSFWRRAQFIHEADIFVLPFTVPF